MAEQTPVDAGCLVLTHFLARMFSILTVLTQFNDQGACRRINVTVHEASPSGPHSESERSSEFWGLREVADMQRQSVLMPSDAQGRASPRTRLSGNRRAHRRMRGVSLLP